MNQMPNKLQHYIIIEGITTSGEVFRPTNWAERMCGKFSTVVNQRLKYSPKLQPITKEGLQCIRLDINLKNSNPELYHAIITFAKNHQLKICDDAGSTNNS